uniref:NADH-ubiquinone oxidoreductase chain 2 n=1 Tax=Linyphia triangularis TaxID=94031 RepID=A0A7L7S5K2_LINTI|nr:NADH dehydrogenase subunit 2 [Linyphia triangularis]
MNSQGLIFFFSLFISSFFLVFSSNDWFFVWMGLEINMFSFMLIISNNSGMEVESCLKYFFIQSLGSGILMLSFYSQISMINYINGLILSYKMGTGPFYFWFPSLCEGISWISCYLLMTIQKIIPLMLMSLSSSEILWFIIVSSLIVGAFGSMNQVKLKRLMAYSSIHHIGWLVLCMMLSISIWWMYLIMYMFMILGVLILFSKNEVLVINFIMKGYESWMFILMMMSMGGIPPMLGFFLKWWIFYYLPLSSMYMYLCMLLMSVVMIYIYMRIIYNLLLGEVNMMSLNLIFYDKFKFTMKDMVYIMGMFLG